MPLSSRACSNHRGEANGKGAGQSRAWVHDGLPTLKPVQEGKRRTGRASWWLL
ncbi:hypothetical protein EJ06DRAFT_530965 [Trichodelitschia bisporula]|uniref:Uncharacterized protein n=1 Tax=Trichodelitschia bisporula TaxID=703511 RepID=A0A6G1HTN5_9PEZI|nr:hypothetical protein EJ06DRAFT_530965 [Trichodelitschia bisporula]